MLRAIANDKRFDALVAGAAGQGALWSFVMGAPVAAAIQAIVCCLALWCAFGSRPQ